MVALVVMVELEQADTALVQELQVVGQVLKLHLH
jgi:hypothetical protein